MVEIIYGENNRQANLAGKSVAEVRELYTPELSIPDRAKASLNGEPLKKELEPEAKLNDGDQLSFEEKSRKGLVMLGALLLTLVITGGLFAYTYTTDSTTISATAVASDYADVSANASISYTFHGRERGKIDGGMLFDVTRASGYTGDLEVNVYLANVDELQNDYSFWMLRVELTDSANVSKDLEGITQVLSLDNPFVTFICSDWAVPRYVNALGGTYRAFPNVHGLTGYNPLIFCQVNQVGP